MSRPIWSTPWQPGPEAVPTGGSDPVTVNITEFTAHRPLDAAKVFVAGVMLRRSWPRTDGALGMWLWMEAGSLRPRSGSVSLWRDRDHLQGFVVRPDHLRIVRAFRGKGELRSATWSAAASPPDAVWEAVQRILTGQDPWPQGPGASGEPAGPASPAES
ncbi:hypothetical protein [Streptomyces sp. NPDC058486]|uniref:hypothetical protein n=1 Tax=unclassified Streptomyces TaxID=2593676 RepID=UPI00364A80A1